MQHFLLTGMKRDWKKVFLINFSAFVGISYSFLATADADEDWPGPAQKIGSRRECEFSIPIKHFLIVLDKN